MAIKDLVIRTHSDSKIQVDPTEIKGGGGPGYPRLFVPVRLDLNRIPRPQETPQNYVVLSLQCGLLLLEDNLKIADASPGFIPYKVNLPHAYVTPVIQFPLDLYRIKKIEESRKDDLKIRLDVQLIVGIYESFILQVEGGVRTEDALSDFTSTSVQLDLEVPQSHWVREVLPSLGYGEITLIELPTPKQIIAEELSGSISALAQAQECLSMGNYDEAVACCRRAVEPIKGKIAELKKSIESDTEYKWVKGIAGATHDWLDKLYKVTRDITSKPHHVPSVGHFSRHDAEAVMLVTTGLIAYVARLTSEHET
ncbi:hypothetical protein E3J62_01310 [candidate division TA06 bacterium]|uniref:Uncharacterized protein n=1 Tax=candidate division TA06 bacterium TaxID=2250710 RepID=A0A523UY89_UNCT6|nr:MAG: hypothetical protein E3J62_01310 [candidate division TA06 bacterium]